MLSTRGTIVGLMFAIGVGAGVPGSGPTRAIASQASGPQRVNLAAQLAAKKLRPVGREVTSLAGSPEGVHVTEGAGPSVVWIEGSEFASGIIEMDVRGRDLLQRSFVGIAFHRLDDNTYEVVYLRPFNFRATDPARHQHAVQYASIPDFDWPRLREEFPEEFENPVDASVSPTDWVPLRVVIKAQEIQIFVGKLGSPTLGVRKLGKGEKGMIGLFVGNMSDGDFANLRITAEK